MYNAGVYTVYTYVYIYVTQIAHIAVCLAKLSNQPSCLHKLMEARWKEWRGYKTPAPKVVECLIAHVHKIVL